MTALVFPLHAVPKPRASGKGWHANRWSKGRGDVERYKTFRDLVRLHLPKEQPPLIAPLFVGIHVWSWNATADPDNVAGGIMDALKPWPLPDDSWKVIRGCIVTRSDKSERDRGFAVWIWEKSEDDRATMPRGLGVEGPWPSSNQGQSQPEKRRPKRR